MTKLRKIFTVSVMFVTILSMSVVVAPDVSAAASAGDLIKTDSVSAVYYLGSDDKRYVFPTEQTYFSWYSDFSGVMTVPQSELESYDLGGNLTVRPGTKLVQEVSMETPWTVVSSKVYAVESSGSLVQLPDADTAAALFGSDWEMRIVGVPSAYFTNYSDSGTEASADAYPEGSLIKLPDSADIYYIDADGNARKIADEAAFSSNRFNDDFVITTAADFVLPTAGADIAGAEDALVDTSQGGGSGTGIDPNAGTGLTVALASDTPASTTIIAGQAIAELAKINFTASADGAVVVKSVKLRRKGVSADTTLSAIYLYDGVNRLIDSATVSSGYISWNNSNGIFTVPAGSTMTISVKSNIAASTSGQTVGVAVEAVSDITTNGATVSGSTPIESNLMSIATATLAGVSFNTTTYPNSDGAPSPQDEFEIWKNTVAVTTRAVDLNYLTFRQLGSINNNDVSNFILYVDGVQVGETVESLDSNGYLTFDLSASPKRLNTGNRVMKVLANIVGGSTRTFSLSLRQAADVSATDTEYGAEVLVQANSTTFSARSSTNQTIASGNLTITKLAAAPSGNVINEAAGITLATYELKATGEKIKVENLRVTFTGSDANFSELRNGALFYNGAQVGSTADLFEDSHATTAYTEYSLGSSVVVEPGSPGTLEVRADVYDGDGTTNHSSGDTIQVKIAVGSSNAQRMTSLGFFNAPGAAVAANTLTVAEGTITLAKYTGYNNHTAVDPQSQYKIAEFRLTSDTTEDINLTSFNLDFDSSTGDVEVADDLNDVYIVYGAKESSSKSTVSSTTNAYSINETLASGGTLAISVYGNVASSIGTNGVLIVDLTVSGTTVGSAATANSSEVSGQSITWSTGSIASAATEDPLDMVTFDDQELTVANYEFTATSDSYTIEQIAVEVASASVASAVLGVKLYDGTTLLNGSYGTNGKSIDGTIATSTGLTLAVPANTTKTVTVKFVLNTVGTGQGTSQSNVVATLEGFWARNSQGTVTKNYTDRAGNAVYVYGSYPVVVHSQLSSSERKITNDAIQSIYQFKVSPSAGGSIAFKQAKFTVAWSDETNVAALELEYFKFYRGTTDITSLVSITDADGNTAKAGSGLTEADSTLVVAFTTEDLISSENIYTIKAIPKLFDSGTTSSDYVSIYMAGDTSAHNGTDTYVDDYLGDHVWRLATNNSGTGSSAYNFIWSDRTAVGHSSVSGTSTADWANGYLVDYLPLTSTIMDKNPS